MKYLAGAVPDAFDRADREAGDGFSFDLENGAAWSGPFRFDIEQGGQEMMKAAQYCPEHQCFCLAVSAEQEDPARISFGINLDNLQCREHRGKKVLAVRPGGSIPSVGCFVPEFHVVDASALLTT